MAQIPGSVRVTGFIAPSDSQDVYASHDSFYGKGGFREVETLLERDAITAERRRQGMLCFVKDTKKIYQLLNGIENVDWEELAISGFEPEVTKVLHVDINRLDDYTARGTLDKPFKSIQEAVTASTSGTTIHVVRGTYTENLVFPSGVSLVSNAQNQVIIEGNVTFDVGNPPISIVGIVFRNGIVTINAAASIRDCYSYSQVVFGETSYVTAWNFNIEPPADVHALMMNSNNMAVLNSFTIRTQGLGSGVIQTKGQLVFNNIRVQSYADTIVSNGGTILFVASQLVNLTNGTCINVSNNSAIESNPNMLGDVVCNGDIIAGEKHILVEGLKFIQGTISGTNILYRPASMIDNDSNVVGKTVKDALNTLNSYVVTGFQNLSEKNQVNGYAGLDENGLIPSYLVPAHFKEGYVVANIDARNALLNKFIGMRAYVIDATADSTVDLGAAEYIWNGSAWYKVFEEESMDLHLDDFLKDDGSVTLKGNLIPQNANTIDLGSETKPFKNIYAKDIHISANSLYVNNKKIISDVSDTITFSTDIDQHMIFKTEGLGTLTVRTFDGDLLLHSNKLIKLLSTGVDIEVPVTQPTKHITMINASNGGNITFTATGNNSNIQLKAKEKNVLEAPVTQVVGDLDITGNFVWNGLSFPNISNDSTMTDASNNNISTQLAIKTYIENRIAFFELDQNITFEVLNANGDVGINSDQLALGSHDHTNLTIKPLNIEMPINGTIIYKNGGLENTIFNITPEGNYTFGSVSKELNIHSSVLKYNDIYDVYHSGNLNIDNLVVTTDSRLNNDRIPLIHGNEKHNKNYIDASEVTFVVLNNNNVIGSASTQIAVGNHTHSYVPLISPEEGTIITGDVLIDGNFNVNGELIFDEVTVSNTEKLNNKVASYNAAPDSILISDANGKLDPNYIPSNLFNPPVHITSDNITFVEDFEIQEGHNITLEANTTLNNLKISSYVDSWKNNVNYKAKQIVVFSNKLYQAIIDHTSSSTFGADMIDGNVKWVCLSTANIINNWDFDYSTHDVYLISATQQEPRIVHIPLNDVKSIDLVKVDIVKFVYDNTGFEWPNMLFAVSNFTEDEQISFDYDENYIDMNGIASIKTQYVTNLIDQGTLGTGKYFKAHIDISNFKRTIKFELLKDAV